MLEPRHQIGMYEYIGVQILFNISKDSSLEINRAFLRINTLIILIAGSIVGITEVLNNPVIHLSVDDYWDYPLGAYNWWSLHSVNMFQSAIITIFPLLAVFGYSDSYLEDEKSKMLINFTARCSKTKYLSTRFLVNFIIGGISVCTPLIVNLLCYLMLVPNIEPNLYFGNPPVNNFLPNLYLSNPLLHIVFRTLLCFLYGGVVASLCLTISLFIKNKYKALLTPFLIFTILDVVLGSLGAGQYSPLTFLFSDVPFSPATLIIGISLLFVTGTIFIFGGRRLESL